MRLDAKRLALGTLVALLVTTAPVVGRAGIIQIIDKFAPAAGNQLEKPLECSLAIDSAGNVYVSGNLSDNAFKITPEGIITEIIDTTGDGAGNTLNGPYGIAVDTSGNVYVAGIVPSAVDLL